MVPGRGRLRDRLVEGVLDRGDMVDEPESMVRRGFVAALQVGPDSRRVCGLVAQSRGELLRPECGFDRKSTEGGALGDRAEQVDGRGCVALHLLEVLLQVFGPELTMACREPEQLGLSDLELAFVSEVVMTRAR